MGARIKSIKEHQPCQAGLAMLNEQIQLVNETEDNPFIPDAEEMIDAAPLETIVDEDEEGDSDIEID